FQQGGGTSPNIIGGHANNATAATFSGQTVSGGGRNGSTCWNPITFDFTRLCANVANNNFATVGGGIASTAGGDSATVGGGSSNAASGDSSTVSGGFNNVAAATRSTVGGGEANRASSVGATIGGGNGNSATGNYSTVAGGEGNQATGLNATAGGGTGNVASGLDSTIAGGALNFASASQATVGGGGSNQAIGVGSTVIGGISNVASGLYSTVIAGFDNTASGMYSVAAGRLANADQNGCFVFASWSTNNPMGCFGWQNVMRFGANHGFSFDFGTQRLDGGGQSWIAFGDTVDILNMINTSSGARLTVGGAWTDSSDRAKKRDFEPVRPIDVLRHVADLPISTWSYIQEPESIRHMGAVAQDFYAAFGLGEDDKHISALDTGGVALAAIQGLYQVVQEKDARIGELQSHVAELERERLTQVARIDALEKQAAEIAALKSQVLEIAARTESTQLPSPMAAVGKSIFDARLQ
ncbi:MAG TPA: hypothetical protein PLW68_11690, partial [Casimicrobiaceae bacterium]|nr:hypothetical protein [Casimicrobiaceae bacterium]